jgi:hypothetical protein
MRVLTVHAASAHDRHQFLLRTARAWFEKWTAQDCYQVADIIYDWLFAVFMALGLPAALEFVRATLTQDGVRFFPVIVAVLRLMKALKMDKNGHLDSLKGELVAAAKAVGGRRRVHAAALELAAAGRIRAALDLAKFEGDCAEADALNARLAGHEADGGAASDDQWERIDVSDGDVDSTDGEPFERIEPAPDVYELFEPVTPPPCQSVIEAAAAEPDEGWAEPIGDEGDNQQSLELLRDFPAHPVARLLSDGDPVRFRLNSILEESDDDLIQFT